MSYVNKYKKYKVKCQEIYNQNGGNSDSDSDDSKEEIPLVKIVQLGLTDEEKEIVHQMKIEKTRKMAIFYESETVLDKITEYINDIGENKTIDTDLAKIIKKIIENVIEHENEESAIIWIRASVDEKSDPKFRWHRDGGYFKLDKKKPLYKFAASLRGESTPVVTDKESIEKFNVIYDKKMKLESCFWNFASENDISFRDIPRELLEGLEKLTAPPLIETIGDNYIRAKTLEEGAYFLNMKDGTDGKSTNGGTIHSEPSIQKDRLFIAILPGPKDKCKAWTEKQKK